MFKREINPYKSKSYFLFGPRQTGKSTLVKSLLSPKDLYIDLLPQRTFLNYAKNPGRAREEILAHLKLNDNPLCIIDEIQKIPTLLDEVHELIESKGIRFILTGSCARKLRRGNANLLAGRAYTYHLFPLTFTEIGDKFDLDKALKIGCLPPLWGTDDEDCREFLKSYTETYLKEEVSAEGLVRNIGPFAQFLDIAAANDEDLVVSAPYRGHEIGERLLEMVENRAIAYGAKRLQLLADKNNTPALHFYDKKKWQRTQLVCLMKKFMQLQHQPLLNPDNSKNPDS